MNRKKKDTTLYVIGNGFDLYHDFKTSYQKFALFLQKHEEGIHQYLIDYFSLPYLEKEKPEDEWDPLWSEFERALADLDIDALLEDNRDLTPDFTLDDFKTRDMYYYEAEMQSVVDLLTKDLRKSFKKFILSVQITKNMDVDILGLDKDARYLSFNYTNTLEKLYNITHKNITYIHGFALDNYSDLILGHGVDPDIIQSRKNNAPDNLSDQEKEEWYKNEEDNYEFAYEEAKTEILNYFYKSFKSTSEVIKENTQFFDDLKDIETINVLGHSVSEVDHPYFKKIIDSTKNYVKWFVTYHNESEKADIMVRLINLGIRKGQITLVKMNYFKPKHPNLFD